MRVLMTGATGFIGRNLARALLAQGHELVCAVRDPARLDLGVGTWRAVQVDLAAVPDAAFWRPHLVGIDAVINAVGIIREQAGQTFAALHDRAPSALFQAAADVGVRVVVQVSALGADASAQSRYHRSKKAADDTLRALPLSGAVVHPSIVYGDSPGSAMFHTMAASPMLAMPQAGGMQVQPVHVDDVVQGILAVLHAPRGIDRFISPQQAPALRARIWRDLGALALKAGAMVAGLLVLIAAIVWALAR